LYFAHRFEEARMLVKELPESHSLRAFTNKLSLVSK